MLVYSYGYSSELTTRTKTCSDLVLGVAQLLVHLAVLGAQAVDEAVAFHEKALQLHDFVASFRNAQLVCLHM